MKRKKKMPQFNKILDPKLRKNVEEAYIYTESLIAGKIAYNFRKLMGQRDDIVKSFEKYIKHRRDEIKGSVKNYDTTKKTVRGNFKYDEQNIITTFERNVIRAFGQAAHSIEKEIGQQLSAPGSFGVRALLSLTRKRVKPESLKRVEGYSRLAGPNNRIFRIDLIPYIIMLIRTAQAEWDRKLQESIAVSINVDLGYISQHPCWLGPKANEVCNRWRDKIVSISGLTPGFPRLEDARAEKPPLFHPNCTHTVNALTQNEENTAIAKKIKTYSTLKRHI